jgi:hypothetical protein
LAPAHVGLGTSVTAVVFWKLLITYGPADQVGTVVLKKVVTAESCALVPVPCGPPPCFAAMCAGMIGPNSALQSEYGELKTTVTVRPLFEPVSDLIWS